ncbi:hypothetical protein SI65_09833 [Aspergillus cristatus]|uniref:UBR-type domain-containing protein n=1 Tax=Aspergillus cristatus TaxID=573508 RepID=A0A1E3B1P5_ASPCR|nr:hypothetical protein SI65_09833 [Aspergillus cristatus]
MDNSEGARTSRDQETPKAADGIAMRRDSLASHDSRTVTSEESHTAKEFIENQLQLEADAREALPYSFDSCSQVLGPLRQNLFACITCNQATNPDESYTPAGVCYSCSISCHGEHTLVELFGKRDFVCDCGTTRLPPSAPCTLRNDPKTGQKGVHSQEPAANNQYNQNFQNKFCGCGESYDAEKEKGTMFQCLGLGTVETGGCGEDWWHPECIVGLPRDWHNTEKKEGEEHDEDEEPPLPPGFPAEDDFETFLCYKCIESNPWLKRYAGTPGFLPPIHHKGDQFKVPENSDAGKEDSTTTPQEHGGNAKKRKLEDEEDEPAAKKPKADQTTPADPEPKSEPESKPEQPQQLTNKHDTLPKTAPTGIFSLFLKEDFRNHLCRCPECYPHLSTHRQLREEEETYEPPLSEAGDEEPNGGGSTGTGSLLDRGEAALSNMDRVRAIEGAMVYNHLRDKVKEFLKPFAESGTAVGAEDIKEYFAKLRGDDPAAAASGDGESNGNESGNRREQSGY